MFANRLETHPHDRVNLAGMSFRRIWTVFLLLIVLGFIVSCLLAGDDTGSPKQAIFDSIPPDGPYLLDDHGRITEVERATYVQDVWIGRVTIFLFPILGLISRIVYGKMSRRGFPKDFMSSRLSDEQP